MTSWISWIFIGVMIAVFIYAMLSVYLRKPIGLYIAAAFHIVLGILSLPSIGLYVLGVALIELIIGIIITIRTAKTS